MESDARDQGTNRWFVTTPETRTNSAMALKADLRRLEKKGYRGDQIAGMINELVTGVNLFLFNCPIDMVIERRIREDYPELREAQFCGLASIAHNSRKVTMDPKIRDFVPPTLLRINDILNALFALFVDELSEEQRPMRMPIASSPPSVTPRNSLPSGKRRPRISYPVASMIWWMTSQSFWVSVTGTTGRRTGDSSLLKESLIMWRRKGPPTLTSSRPSHLPVSCICCRL